MFSNSRVKILVVDDEKNILKAIKRMSFELDMDIDFVISGVEAIRAFKEQTFDILITDIKMPDIDGLKLLNYVKDNYPTTTRIVLSGHVDGNLVFDIIKKSLAHTFMYKPWDNEKLIYLLKKVNMARKIALDEGIMDIVGSIDVLSIHPTTLEYIKSYYPFNEDDGRLIDILNNDPALAIRFIRISNSLDASLRPTTIEKGLNYLTKDQSNKILQEYILDSKLVMQIKEGSRLDESWSYMMMNKKIIELLYPCLFDRPISKEEQLIGLLFDIGQLIELEYGNLLKGINISPEKLGGAILNLWGMPLDLVDCALYHNDPFNPNIRNKELIYLISLSKHINSIINDKAIPGFDYQRILKEIGKSDLDLKNIIEMLSL